MAGRAVPVAPGAWRSLLTRPVRPYSTVELQYCGERGVWRVCSSSASLLRVCGSVLYRCSKHPLPSLASALAMPFQLKRDEGVLCFDGTDGDNDPKLNPQSCASGSPVSFEREGPYLVCWSQQFPRNGRKHFVGIAEGGGHLFCAWDANCRDKYKWHENDDSFTHYQTGLKLTKQ